MNKSDFNVIFSQILVRMWKIWSTRLINTQKVEISWESGGFMSFWKTTFSEKWLQILKIVKGSK